MSAASQYVRLSTGFNMPLVGIGTFRVTGREIIHDVLDHALCVGYMSIDTAAVYRNEEDIGHSLKKLMDKYSIEREEIFITTKLSPSDNGDPRRVREAVERSLKALNLSYIDLYLIHWPGAAGIPEGDIDNIKLRSKTWEALVDLKAQGFLRSIGVSNYNISHLERLMQDCKGVRPAVNQVELHPHYRQKELVEFCNKEGIHVQAYSSLGTSTDTSLLKDPTVCRVAQELGVSPARVLLKWALQQGIGIIPKAVQTTHIFDNFQLDFAIHESQMDRLSSLPQHKYAWNPNNVV
ncbi:aldo-keto reductase family 4 member C9-like isoform X2 [Fopius arisanus]|uniref:Aldo-keto reductase family 4 member C9-like isoform X2 n=1 Tax=Fopius arisanus TaxID=64838 RepID=A0A9R1T6R1_9HYME|nr:PREDICTED: aldo-keto reductase family 4 member C9-like isoform X2 [Fopius arisanus]